MITPKDILVKARELYAAAPSHAPAGSLPPLGTHCLVLALDRAIPRGPEVVYDDARSMVSTYKTAVDAIHDIIGRSVDLVDYNAEHSTEDVLGVFDRAIEAVA